MKNKNKKNKEVRGVGRPAAEINYPNRKFTFTELVAENTHVTPLCLRLTLKRDAAFGKKSFIVKLDEKRPNASGKGRNLEVYQKRSRQGIGSVSKPVAKSITVEAVKIETPAVAPVAPTPTPAEAPLSAAYEAQKAELGIATPTPTPAAVA